MSTIKIDRWPLLSLLKNKLYVLHEKKGHRTAISDRVHQATFGARGNSDVGLAWQTFVPDLGLRKKIFCKFWCDRVYQAVPNEEGIVQDWPDNAKNVQKKGHKLFPKIWAYEKRVLETFRYY